MVCRDKDDNLGICREGREIRGVCYARRPCKHSEGHEKEGSAHE